MKLLELSALCLRCEVGALLSQERIWQIFSKCLAVSNDGGRAGNQYGRMHSSLYVCLACFELNHPCLKPQARRLLG